jgi:hypothetical protein
MKASCLVSKKKKKKKKKEKKREKRKKRALSVALKRKRWTLLQLWL